MPPISIQWKFTRLEHSIQQHGAQSRALQQKICDCNYLSFTEFYFAGNKRSHRGHRSQYGLWGQACPRKRCVDQFPQTQGIIYASRITPAKLAFIVFAHKYQHFVHVVHNAIIQGCCFFKTQKPIQTKLARRNNRNRRQKYFHFPFPTI
jgi:hypothetical protein